jgi:hypothetical protein
MTGVHILLPLILGIVLLAAPARVRAQTHSGVMLKVEQKSGWQGSFVFVSGPAVTNYVLETSIDLKTWRNVFQAFGWPGTNPVFRVGPGWQTNAHAFWRAFPGETLETQEQRWREQEPIEYTYRFRHMVGFWQGGVQGTVRVREGVVIAVTDARDDQTLEPIPQPDLSQFLTITRLLSEIRREFETGSEQVLVVYEPGDFYPTHIFVDRVVGLADDEAAYQASSLEVVQPR